MKTISLEESKNIKLFKRFESKYVVDSSDLGNIMNYLSDNYMIVQEDENTLFDYYSIYFDNSDFDIIKATTKDDNVRQKIRIREYQNNDKFLEIKEKNHGIIIKTRIPIKSYNIDDEKDWIDDNLIYNTSTLNNVLRVKYKRLTFINKSKSNRITVDMNVDFYNYITNKSFKIDNFIIIEIKKNKEDNIDFEDYLNKKDIYKTKFSKYYYGMKQTSDNIEF